MPIANRSNSYKGFETFQNKFISQYSLDHPSETLSEIVKYYPGIRLAMETCQKTKGFQDSLYFEPEMALPDLDESMVRFYDPAKIISFSMGDYRGRTIRFLNLCSDPSTQTTKTFASLIMVARAIAHIRKTGEKILILTPTSANKGTALRSAVDRAIQLKLVPKEKLRIAIIAPEESTPKLRKSQLSEDPELGKLNPVFVYTGLQADQVKEVGKNFMEENAEELWIQHQTRVWYSLNIDNYKVADSIRAYYDFEHQLKSLAPIPTRQRFHAHSVSSGYGLIGYHLGRTILASEGLIDEGEYPGYFLIQHLATPDLVIHSQFQSFSRSHLPLYVQDPSTGLFCQNSDAHFPKTTYSLDERLDSTFYTHSPATASTVKEMIDRFGGEGIVVSLHECLERYPFVRIWLNRIGFRIPTDPRNVLEWSLVMAFTGVLNGIDRSLIPANYEITIHGSGFYAASDYRSLSVTSSNWISDQDALEKMRAGIFSTYISNN